MREPTIARNYAEALLQLGEKSGNTELFADLIRGISNAVESDLRIRQFLESPRVPKRSKQDILGRALAPYAPLPFVRFIEAVVKRGRQGLLVPICQGYLRLVDDKFNRVHAGVTLARQPDASLQEMVRRRLSEVLGKEVIPQFRTDPDILGGLVVRIGDRVMDGSLRRRMVVLRRKLVGA